MGKLISRFPDKNSITIVFSIATFLLYGWTLYASFRKLPSWLYYLEWGEIVSIYAYSFLVNFFESIVMLVFLIFVGFVLPAILWRNQFVVKSVIAEIIIIASAIRRLRMFHNPDIRDIFVNGQWNWWGWTFILVLSMSLLFGHVSWLRKQVESLAERFVIFLYLYMPLTGIAFFIVAGRLLF